MGFLAKLRDGLAKTKNAIWGRIDAMLKAFVRVDEDLLEELEELLITADVGVSATEEILDRLREEIKEDRLKSPDQIKDALKVILADLIGEAGTLGHHAVGDPCDRRERCRQDHLDRQDL